jgi:hypothetical protein
MSRHGRCIVHAGTHKTGTTTVQDLLASHRTQLAAAGVHYPALQPGERDHNSLAHRLATCTQAELPSLRAALLQGLGGSGTAGHAATLLISAEELSTRIGGADPWAGFDDGAYWERRRQFLARLRGVLPEALPVEVYLCLRDHESYAHALYATKLLSGRIDWSFDEFVKRCAPIFDYPRQVQVFEDTLGPVSVQGFDRLRGDLANRFFGWIGVPLQVRDTPRLRPTPTLDLVYWLFRSLQSPMGREQRKLRAEYCRRHPLPTGRERAAVHSLWQSERQRQEFLGSCRAAPIDGWPPPPAQGRIADPSMLAARADQIEAEFEQWRRRGGQRKHWIHFWRWR